MTSRVPILAFAFAASLIFFVSLNYFSALVENTLAFRQLGLEPAQAALLVSQQQNLEEFKPLRNWQIGNFDSRAESAVVVLANSQGQPERILYSKNSEQPRAVASISKLLSALLVVHKGDLSQPVVISELLAEDNGQLAPASVFAGQDLLRLALIASNNTAMQNLSNTISGDIVLQLNNLAAQLGMRQSTFVNVSGLDPDQAGAKTNMSSALDVAKLALAVLQEPQLVEMLATPQTTIQDYNGLSYELHNTNELLAEPEVIFGKTGFTPLAGGCLVLVTRAPLTGHYLVSVVLGSNNRFADTQELNSWVRKAYLY